MKIESDDPIRPDPFKIFSDMLRKALGNDLSRAANFIDMFADDALIDHPYASPNSATCMNKADFERYYAKAAHVFSIARAETQNIYRCHASPIVIVEYRLCGIWKESDQPYEQQNVGIIEIEDGRIRRYREYFNPDVLNKIFGKSPLLAY